MSTAERVVFEHVTKRYPGTGAGNPGAVEDLSLEVPAGKVCVLVGPSGCGKTTSLKMVNRLIEPTSGRILIGDRDVAKQDVIELRRGIGYVIQQVGLFPHQTVGENVATVPRLLGWDESRRRARASELLELVGLDPARYADRYPSALSGGERQRVGVARALAADPPVLLMDEPFGAVDPIVRERLQNELLRLQEQLAKTILFVTHDIDEAIKMGDLVAVMQVGGHLAQFGTPDEILANPASDFVGRFVGADRGLKRLALSRVGDLDLQPAVTARAGSDAAEARKRVLADPFPYLLVVDERDRPLGWLDQQTIPEAGVIDAAAAMPPDPVFDPYTTLKDAFSMLLASDVQAGVVVGDGGAVRGLVTADMIGERMRPGGLTGPMIDWAWMAGHLGDLAGRTVQHFILAGIAVGLGFVLSLGLSIAALRRQRLRALLVTASGVLYTIPSLAMFAGLVPITGLTILTAEVPLTLYTLLIFMRNILAGLDAVAPDVIEAADAMGYSGRDRLVRVELPLALPLIVGGVRLASVSTIGLVTISGILGDRFGGLGFFIFEGIRHSFPTEVVFGALPTIALAIAIDLGLVAVQRRLTPWTRTTAVPAFGPIDGRRPGLVA